MKRRKTRLVVLTLLVLGVFILPGSRAAAQTPEPPTDDEVNAIARDMYCPICENTPLDVCPTDACRQWRELIRQMLAEGKSEAEIEQYFVEQYGMRVLSAPPLVGISLVAYLLMLVAFLAGLGSVIFILVRWQKNTVSVPGADPGALPAASNGSSPAMDDYLAQVETELTKMEHNTDDAT